MLVGPGVDVALVERLGLRLRQPQRAGHVEAPGLVCPYVALDEVGGRNAVAVGEDDEGRARPAPHRLVQDPALAKAGVLLPDVLERNPLGGERGSDRLEVGTRVLVRSVVGDHERELARTGGLAEEAPQRASQVRQLVVGRDNHEGLRTDSHQASPR